MLLPVAMLTRRQFASLFPAPLLAQQRRRPNLVVILSDDHHWQALGAAGNPNIRTPNLDKLAARGVRFSNAIISSSQCAPSRGILLSGQESYQTGLDSNANEAYRTFSGATVVEQLRRAGYQTNLVGKWHIQNTPKQCGFTNGPVWLSVAATPYPDPELRHGLDATTNTKTPGLTTDIFTREAVQVIEKAQQPYLLWLAYNAPHTPWTASEAFRKLYEGRNAQLAPPQHPKPTPRAPGAAAPAPKMKKKGGGPGGNRPDGMFDWETYYAVISEMDAGIGRVIDAVDRSGQWENTLILFLGDNGYLCGSKGLQGKVFAWEESIRVPFLAAGAGVKSGVVSDALVASVDVPATLLDAAGVKPGHKLAGTSIRLVLSGGRFSRDAAFSNWNDSRPEALYAGYGVEAYRVARTTEWKYILWESKKQALYQLKADPFEEKDLAEDPAHAADLKRMQARLRARMKETADPASAWL
ncbi:MAG: sulfatase-like hydrolase/transferase [Bryobacterales bacterium]|nr:sulfatase-like hydrolase/transferase [Bryobacterales bacterium]